MNPPANKTMMIQIADLIESPTTKAIARLFGVLCDLGLGGYISLLGFGMIQPKRNLEKGTRILKKYGMFFRIAGPVIALKGLVGLLQLI